MNKYRNKQRLMEFTIHKTDPRGFCLRLIFPFFFLPATLFGTIIFQKTYGGTSYDYGESVQQTTDGGYIIAGWTYSYGAGSYDVYIIKIDAQGDTLWTRTYGGTDYDYGYSVQQTTDGGYIIAGWTASYGAGGYDVYLIKTDAQGDTLWTRTYGGTDYDYSYSVQQTTDGGYIIAGFTGSYGANPDSTSDIWLIKTDSLGDTLWTKTYGGTSDDHGLSVQQTTDGGYIIAGVTNSYGAGGYDVYLIKTDAQGDTLWTRTYGGTDYDCGSSVQQTTDGGYIIAGVTNSYGAGGYDVYLIKTDAQGDTLWTRTYGGTDYDCGSSVQQTTDGGYIIAGVTNSYGAGGYDVYLIKTDENGNIDNTPPSSPQSLTANGSNPSPWTNNSKFVLNWTNPSDESGIAKALYKLSSAPISNYDTTGSFSPNPPDSVVITTEGVTPLYLWLEDGAGNVDYNNNASVDLRYDNTPPQISHSPITNANQGNDVSISANITDVSGIAQARVYYKRGGDAGYSYAGMIKSGGTFTGSIPGAAVTIRGVEYYIEATDSSGNTGRYPSSGAFGIRVKTNNESRPVEVYGSEQNAYRIISIPLILDNPDPHNVLEDDFGGYDETKWRFCEWKDGRWVFLDDSGISRFSPGKGFFLIVRDAGKTITTGSGMGLPQDTTFYIPLQSGWNLIGNPFAFEIPDSFLSLENGEQLVIYSYKGSWDIVHSILPFEGYAVKVQDSTNLIVKPEGGSHKGSSSSFSPTAIGKPPSAVVIIATCESARDEINYIGTAEDAKVGKDRYDLYEPPPVGEYVSLYFPHKDWGKYADNYTTDIRPKLGDFDFEVKTNILNSTVQLAFTMDIPETTKVYLQDKDLNIYQDIREKSTYSFPSGKNVRHFSLVFGKDIPLPERTTLYAFPSIFAHSTLITYTIPPVSSGLSVMSVKIYDLTGRLINTIDEGKKKAGTYTVLWDGKDNMHHSIPSGIYFVHLKVENNILTKKIVLMR